MAPLSGSSKARRAGAKTKQPGARPVVPALPLPYVKRQAAAAATATATATAAASAAADTVAEKPSPAIESTSETQQTNGAAVHDGNTNSGPVSAPSAGAEPSPPPPPPPSTERMDPNHTIGEDANGSGPVAIDAVESLQPPSGSTTESGLGVVTAVGHSSEPSNSNDSPPRRNNGGYDDEASGKYNGGGFIKADPKQQTSGYHIGKHNKPGPPQSMSPPRYQMPPPFQPSNRTGGMVGNGDVHRGPRPLPNGPPRMHSAHPSTSSVHFGAFHDSQSSSPAPPLSGGIAPPPGMPVPDGRQPYMGHAGNGFPPMLPYGADMMPVSSFENYGRHAAAYAPMDSYPPYGNGFGPSTPHSYHDSQSSANPEDTGIYSQYPPGAHRSGANGPSDDIKQQNPQGRMFGPPDYHRMMPSQGLPPHMMSQGDDGDGLAMYLQSQFSSPELGDCTLELRYRDDRAPPVRIPGHRLLFARSAELAQLLRQQTQQSSPSDRSLQTLLVETDSKWVRSDSFYMAVQRLYGLPLLHIPPPRSGLDSGDVTDAGSAVEQSDFALSYAAAGHLLDWSPIAKRGCEVATQLLSWQTVERALAYALDGYSDRGSHEAYTYGEGSRMILNAIVVFIVHNFPFNFSLDITVPEPELYDRLPLHLPEPPTPTPAAAMVTSPMVAHGSVQLGKGRRSQQLPNIQFGDLSLSEGKNGATAETPKATKQALPVSHDVLSRILLNIPFTQLKMILESAGSGNVNGWANSEARYRIIKSAVEERETRRLRVLDVVVNGRVADAESIRAGLQSPGPQALGRWTVLGWQEEILPYGNLDGPSLARKWTPLVQQHNSSVAEYP